MPSDFFRRGGCILLRKLVLLFLLPLCLLSGCRAAEPQQTAFESDELQFAHPVAGDTIAVFDTSMGEIRAVLFPDGAPRAVENFVTLARQGYYDELSFHRVIEDFLIQSGDPTGTGTGGQSAFGGYFADEISDRLHNYTGALAMANSGEDSNGSQFFYRRDRGGQRLTAAGGQDAHSRLAAGGGRRLSRLWRSALS